MTTSDPNSPLTVSVPREGESEISVRDLLYMSLSRWRWFAVSMALTLALAVLYVKRTPPVYSRYMEVMIQDNTKSGRGMMSDLNQFSDMGLFTVKSNVHNELIAIQSPAVLGEVARRLRLDMEYYRPGFFYDRTAYGADLPLTAGLVDLPDNCGAGFRVSMSGDGSFILDGFFLRTAGGVEEYASVVPGRLNDTLPSPVGRVVLAPTCHYREGEPFELLVRCSGLYAARTLCGRRLTAALNDKQASVITLSYEDLSIQRAEDVLNTIISVYNESWVKDKNQIAVSTSMFINDRLSVIERELSHVDEDISSYKSENLLPDLEAASSLYLTKSSQTTDELLALGNELYMARYIRSYLSDPVNRHQLLPANSGIGSHGISAQIDEYNSRLLQRNSLVANSSVHNPLVADADSALENLRRAIIVSIDNQTVTLDTRMSSLRAEEARTTSKIADSPGQARYLLSVERQQKVKESLYLFLLQKREENELSQTFTAYNTRVITPPVGSYVPISPQRRNILLIAIVLGLAIPFGVLFARESMNTRVRGRKDLERLSVPFVGEIPLWPLSGQGRRRPLKLRLRSGPPPSRAELLVREGRRDVVNEAFRVLRTNLEFMCGRNDRSGASVVAVTSFNPGSGKSFLSMNTAVSLAIKSRRVLVIDGDLRHGSSSQYVGSPGSGVTDYLSGREDDVRRLIVRHPVHKGLHVLPVGAMPPNPTELLEGGRLSVLVDGLRPDYDYILIDCPPIEIVADTQIIGQYADRTVFVVRAGLLERSMLPELERLYKERKYKNMCLALNGTEGRKGNYRYGYRYGYHYGYGYGYHYGAPKGGEG